MAEELVTIYFAGAVLTGISSTNLKNYYRCVLLWPVFWVYLLCLLIEAAVDEVRHG